MAEAKSTLPVGTVKLSHLSSKDPALIKSVQETLWNAFGPKGPGIVLVNDLPDGYFKQREVLLEAGRRLPSLPEAQLSELEFPDYSYMVGWSHGRETFNGHPDTNKASFYANPMHEDPSNGNSQLVEKYPCYMHPNKWPDADITSGLQTSFRHVGRLIQDIALLIAKNCDSVVQNKTPVTRTPIPSLYKLLLHSRAAKGRLLHYFPPMESSSDALWCAYHNDNGAITGLLPSQYYNPAGTRVPPDERVAIGGGLHIAVDGSAPRKVNIPCDCIAFQIGEVAQIVTGGLLRATAHAVHTAPSDLTRVTLAVFLQPNPWEVLHLPEGVDAARALATHARVPPLSERFRNGDDFAQFSNRTFAKYY